LCRQELSIAAWTKVYLSALVVCDFLIEESYIIKIYVVHFSFLVTTHEASILAHSGDIIKEYATHLTRSNRGLGIQNRDEGTVTDVVFSNIQMDCQLWSDVWWGQAEPIYVTSYPRANGNHKFHTHDGFSSRYSHLPK
jgi:hypothetical protein